MRRIVRGALFRLRAAGRRRQQAARTRAAERLHESHAAGFHRWLDRRSLRLQVDVPHVWSGIAPPEGPFPKLAVVIHVFYVDMLPDLISRLDAIPVDFDVLLTNASGEDLPADSLNAGRARSVRVFPVTNKGRDILPLVELVNAGLLEPYELVLKVHTKRSEWRDAHQEFLDSGGAWREDLLDSVLGGEERVRSILSAFSSDPGLGIVTDADTFLGPGFWGSNQSRVRDLLKRVELPLDAGSLEFAAGSIYWARAFVLQGLRALDLRGDDFEPEEGQVDGTTAHALERAIGVLAKEAGFTLGDVHEQASSIDGWRRFDSAHEPSPAARAIAFYLPQFHRFAENDAWWGTGFTEWSNVAAARAAFPGHSQPLLPGALGFYDLQNGDTLRRQVGLAEAVGLEGFMYYHYWFAGRHVMNGPIERHVASSDAGPFCLMWANENWTRRWDGGDDEVLLEQDYGRVPATQFIHDVMHLLTDPRYVTVGGAPILAVYRVTQIPDFDAVVDYWRRAAMDAGLPGLTIWGVEVADDASPTEPPRRASGLDGTMAFPPHRMHWVAAEPAPSDVDPRFEGNVRSYGELVKASEAGLMSGIAATRFPGVMVGYDNTARLQWRASLWYGSNPYTYRRWLRRTVEALAEREPDERVVFINAWNEWAECAVLEPSQRWGSTFLLATRDALRG